MMNAWRALRAGNIPAAIQLAGRSVGLELRRNGPSARDDVRLANFLANHGINLVFDIGANRGQFATQLFANGYRGGVVSFEAIPQAHCELTTAAARLGDRWQVAPAMALSECDGVVAFHINDSDATSSLLAASSRALDTIPGIRPRVTIDVPTRRLDDIFRDYSGEEHRSFLKIDVQGGEGQVLAGARDSLARVAGLVIELSLCELYHGQPLAFDVLASLSDAGFGVYDITPAYRDSASHKLEQIDVVLFHPDRIA